MIREEGHISIPHMWAYGYELRPPVSRDRLAGIQALLDDGHLIARRTAEVWSGRFINGDEITYILVVSGTPDQDLEVNRKLADEFRRLDAGFMMTASMEVTGLPD